MQRPKPSAELIYEMCGGNRALLSTIYKGLSETPSLKNFYSDLNLDDALAFAAGSWTFRNRMHNSFSNFVESAKIYSVFKSVNAHQVLKYQNIFQWIGKHRSISEQNKPEYEQLNPFKGKNLEQRLIRKLDFESVQQLKDELVQQTQEYVRTDADYEHAKQRRMGDNFGIQMLPFKPNAENYAEAIAKILHQYSPEYEPLNASE